MDSNNNVSVRTKNGSVAFSGLGGFVALIILTTMVKETVEDIFRPRTYTVVERNGVFKKKKKIIF